MNNTSGASHPRPSLPALPWHGSCQCGQVRFTLSKYPRTFYCCHCTECQKQSSSMHGESVLVHLHALTVSGETKIWSRHTDSGNITNCHFCPECGTRLYHQGTHRQAEEAIISLKGGSLEHIGLLEPVGHIWLKSAQAGFRCDPGTLQYHHQPESYDDLQAAWLRKYPDH